MTAGMPHALAAVEEDAAVVVAVAWRITRCIDGVHQRYAGAKTRNVVGGLSG